MMEYPTSYTFYDEIFGAKSQLDCSDLCRQNFGNAEDQKLCNCPQRRFIKRDVLDDLKRKIHKDQARANLNLWAESPIKKMNLKNFQSKARSAGKLPLNKQAEMYKDLQNRVQQLKMRMSAGKHHVHPHPHFKPRANFDDKLDVKGHYRKAVEDLQQKSKKIMQNRIDIGSSKLGSVNKKDGSTTTTTTSTTTTERSKARNVPVVVLMPSSSTTDKPQQEMEAKKYGDTVLERLKEKQKEAVTKMKDKLSLSKNKENESEKKQ
ncbi:unnamed protein product [Ceutorhynchus assimilis]|uniref:Uncharacterized protein n=1 Tax=Ceutorhynchus assimilis TaxID=467358 RepID=A0A9P0DI99_9CUCU|nr:unnamed protein product [Ceutorhynchus assimilis]